MALFVRETFFFGLLLRSLLLWNVTSESVTLSPHPLFNIAPTAFPLGATCHRCSAHAECLRLAGFEWCRCRTGYSGNGFECRDIDECAIDNGGCHAHAICRNDEGSRICVCREGMVGDGMREGGCVDEEEEKDDDDDEEETYDDDDIDDVNDDDRDEDHRHPSIREDAARPAKACQRCASIALCVGAPGSEECRCPPGFRGDGLKAEAEPDDGDWSRLFGDTVGDWIGDGRGIRDWISPDSQRVVYGCEKVQCFVVGVDGNEETNCAKDADCVVSGGVGRCLCRPGFEGDGVSDEGCVPAAAVAAGASSAGWSDFRFATSDSRFVLLVAILVVVLFVFVVVVVVAFRACLLRRRHHATVTPIRFAAAPFPVRTTSLAVKSCSVSAPSLPPASARPKETKESPPPPPPMPPPPPPPILSSSARVCGAGTGRDDDSRRWHGVAWRGTGRDALVTFAANADI